MGDYTRVNLKDVEDSAEKHGFAETQESRFPREDLGLDGSGLAHHVVKPGKRQAFAHRHQEAEEVHVILSGAGTMRVDDDHVDVAPLDVIRVSPDATRAFEAGPEGLEYVVFSPRYEGDAEIVQSFWGD
jgi:mannose-6-phosphate isomerase-like protein (cupin superfamily)